MHGLVTASTSAGVRLQGKKLTAAVSRPAAGRRSAPVQAMMGGQEPRERKFITREEEPADAWLSKGEREGKSPFQDPVTLVGATIFFFPFVALLIALASGAVDFEAARAY